MRSLLLVAFVSSALLLLLAGESQGQTVLFKSQGLMEKSCKEIGEGIPKKEKSSNKLEKDESLSKVEEGGLFPDFPIFPRAMEFYSAAAAPLRLMS